MQQTVEAPAPTQEKQSRRLKLRLLRAKWLVAAVILIAGIAAAVPFYFSRYEQVPGGGRVRRLIATHDLWMHLYTMEQFDKGLRSGIIYPRWVPDINHGYGILTLIYYPPAFFYLTSAVHAVVNDWLDTLFVITALALAGSGLALYFLARIFYSVLASVVGALLYMMFPIHMLDLYWRGGLPQFIGYVFPPLVIYFAYKLGREGKPRHYAGLAVFYGLHLLTHLPVGLMFTYALAFYAAVWALKERDWKIGARLTGAMALGLMLSAIYWLPAALESKYAYEFASDLFPYHQSYVSLAPVTDSNPYYDLWRLLNNMFAFNALALIVGIAIVRAVRRQDRTSDGEPEHWSPISMWILMAIATVFMCSSFSIYISKLLPKIQVAVPAWRWLTLAAMFTSLLIAAVIDLVRKGATLKPKILWVCRAAIVVVIGLNVWLSIRWSVIRPLSHPTYRPAAATAHDVIESSWTPKESTRPQELADTPLVVTEPEGAAVEITRWDPQDREIYVRADKPTTVRLKTYNFPGWTARIDRTVVPMLSDRDGVQQVEVPPGIHKIQASFENTLPRKLGLVLFGMGLLTIASLRFWDYRRAKSKSAAEKHPGLTNGLILESEPNLVEEKHVSNHLKSKTKVVVTTLVLVVTVVIAGFVFIRWLRSGGEPPPSSKGPVTEATGSNAAATGVGSEARLSVGGLTSIPVALDVQSLDELINALSIQNGDKVEEMIQSGRLIRVNSNTRVRILELRSAKLKVRILEGESITMDGWVPERWIKQGEL